MANKQSGWTKAGWSAWGIAILVALSVFVTEQVIEHFARQGAIRHHQADVLDHLSAVRARLEGVINSNLLMIHGISAVIAAQPDIDQEGFARIASGLVGNEHALRYIAAAPDMVVTLIYPIVGNEEAIGLDYRTHPTQKAAALRAIEEGHSTLAGPLPLVQGGVGIIAREPVFIPAHQPGEEPRPWGLVSAVLDAEKLYRLGGLREAQDDLHMALRGVDGTGASGAVFFGDPALFLSQPVTLDVTLPTGSWQLAALPPGGWGKADATLWSIRLLAGLIAFSLAVSAYLMSYGYQLLRQTTARLKESQNLFDGFMEHLPAGAYIRNPADGYLLFHNRWLREQLMDSVASSHEGSPGFSPGLEREMLANDRRAVVKGELRLEQQLRGNQGNVFYCDTHRFLFPRLKGAALVGCVVSDISARVLAQRRLAENERRLQTLLDTIPELVWLKDPQGVYLACNPGVEAVFGVTKSEIIGKRDHDLVDAQRADFFLEMDQAAVAAGGPSMNEEWVGFASDGHRELLEIIKTPMYGADGTLEGVLGIARDITERKKMEDRLHQQLDELTRWQAGMLNREGRIAELKAEVNALLAQQGRPVRYPSQAEKP